MKHIFLNLKRFDIPRQLGGINSLSPIESWGEAVVSGISESVRSYPEVEFAVFLPEAHLLNAVAANTYGLFIGCQGVHRDDTGIGGNFGAFTTLRTANAAKALGCSYTIIGHCEERKEKAGVLAEGGIADPVAVNRLLNKEILAAQKAGLKVLYCIGENCDEQHVWQDVLGLQLDIGLSNADKNQIIIGYEPVWSIGPGKTPAGKNYISMVASFIKKRTGMDVVYGGGLKEDNARMLASIPEMDGALIALTRFTGDIGFYPDEYQNIVRLYLDA